MGKYSRLLAVIMLIIVLVTIPCHAGFSAALMGAEVAISWCLTAMGVAIDDTAFWDKVDVIWENMKADGTAQAQAEKEAWEEYLADYNTAQTAREMAYWNNDYGQYVQNFPIPDFIHRAAYWYVSNNLSVGENEIIGESDAPIIKNTVDHRTDNTGFILGNYNQTFVPQIRFLASSTNTDNLNDLQCQIDVEIASIDTGKVNYKYTFTKYNTVTQVTNIVNYTGYISAQDSMQMLLYFPSVYANNFSSEPRIRYSNTTRSLGVYKVQAFAVYGSSGPDVIGTVTYNPDFSNYDINESLGKDLTAVVPLVTNTDGTLYINPTTGKPEADLDAYKDKLVEEGSDVVLIPELPVIENPDIFGTTTVITGADQITTVSEGVEELVKNMGQVVPGIVSFVLDLPDKLGNLTTNIGNLYLWVPPAPRAFILLAISLSIMGLITKFIVGLLK